MTDPYKSYKKAGMILADALNYAISITEPGKKLVDIAEEVENRIRKNSAEPAFPLNISINEVAAHYSPIFKDENKIPEKSIVKLDAGVSVNGYITDAARTVIFDDKLLKLKKSSENALQNVLKKIKPESSIYVVGEVAEKIIKQDSFNVIVNLSGHSLARYSLHDGISIPNYNVAKRLRDRNQIFLPGKAYAIEPFATTGAGRVYNDNRKTIFRQFRKWNKNTIPEDIKKVYTYIEENLHELPFSWRWLHNEGFSTEKIEIAKKILLDKQVIHGYPVLVELKRKLVSQAEETIFISENKIEILTK